MTKYREIIRLSGLGLTPSYKSIKNILDTGNDQTEMPDKGKATDNHTGRQQRASMRLQEALITTGGKEL